MPEPINITFLGTGSAIPTIKRNHAAILLHFGPEYILFDCGEGTQLQMEKAGISPMKITGIFISHWHADHFAGLLPLLETLHLSKRKEPLNIYGPDASRFIDALTELSYWGIGFDVIANDVRPNQKIFENDMFEISTVKVKHSVPAVGYYFKEKDHWHIDVKKALKFGLEGKMLSEIKEKGKIKTARRTVMLKDIAKMTPGRKIIYSGDTKISEDLFEAARGIDMLIHDGTYLEEMFGHACVKDVAKMAKKYHVKKLYLTHLSRKYRASDHLLKTVKSIFKNSFIAEDLMKVKL